jgi:hypothetical protein
VIICFKKHYNEKQKLEVKKGKKLLKWEKKIAWYLKDNVSWKSKKLNGLHILL